MLYPYFTLFEIITFLLALFIGAIIFYLVIKRWQKPKFSVALKVFVFYELVSLLFCLIYPFPLLSRLINIGFFKILDLLIVCTILFFIFYFLLKRYFTMDLKKSLITFLLVIMVAFAFLEFFRTLLEKQALNLPIFENENLQMQKQMEIYMQNVLISTKFPEPLSLKIIGKIESGTLTWFGLFIKKLMSYTPYN